MQTVQLNLEKSLNYADQNADLRRVRALDQLRA